MPNLSSTSGNRGKRHPARYYQITAIGTRLLEEGEHGPPAVSSHVEDRLSGTLGIPSGLQLGLLAGAHNPDFPDKSRDVALGVLESWFQRPVAPARWPAVQQAVRARAVETGAKPQDVLMASVRAALLLVQPFCAGPERSFEARLRQKVNEHVTEDFLGPGWRHQGTRALNNADVDPARPGSFDEEEVLAKQYGAQLIRLARLSPAQSEVLAAVAAGYETYEIAGDSDRSESTVRNLLAKARIKLRRARELVA